MKDARYAPRLARKLTSAYPQFPKNPKGVPGKLTGKKVIGNTKFSSIFSETFIKIGRFVSSYLKSSLLRKFLKLH
jgi:hypothetical protein